VVAVAAVRSGIKSPGRISGSHYNADTDRCQQQYPLAQRTVMQQNWKRMVHNQHGINSPNSDSTDDNSAANR